MPEFEGPWNRPPAQTPSPLPGPAPTSGFPVGLAVWLGLIATAVVVVAVLARLNPTAMPKADRPDVWYLFGLLALVSSGLVRMRRFNLSATVRNLAGWTAIFAVIFVGYTFRGDLAAAGMTVRTALNPERAVTSAPGRVVIGKSANGQFYVGGAVDGQPARFMIDTGAGEIVLSPDDATRAGLTPALGAFTQPAETANGVGYTAAAVLTSLTVGSIRLTDVPVRVNKTPMSSSLLGMTFLKRLESYEFKGDQLTLRGK